MRKSGKKGRVILLVLAVTFAALAASQCAVNGVSNASPITAYSKTITLEWDPPWSAQASNFVNLQAYRVYYRAHYGGTWMSVMDVPVGAPPEAVIDNEKVGNGVWDFAVSLVSILGRESELHSSLDDSAEPVGGWFVIWNFPGAR